MSSTLSPITISLQKTFSTSHEKVPSRPLDSQTITCPGHELFELCSLPFALSVSNSLKLRDGSICLFLALHKTLQYLASPLRYKLTRRCHVSLSRKPWNENYYLENYVFCVPVPSPLHCETAIQTTPILVFICRRSLPKDLMCCLRFPWIGICSLSVYFHLYQNDEICWYQQSDLQLWMCFSSRSLRFQIFEIRLNVGIKCTQSDVAFE